MLIEMSLRVIFLFHSGTMVSNPSIPNMMRQASGNVVEPKGEEELRELKEKLGF